LPYTLLQLVLLFFLFPTVTGRGPRRPPRYARGCFTTPILARDIRRFVDDFTSPLLLRYCEFAVATMQLGLGLAIARLLLVVASILRRTLSLPQHGIVAAPGYEPWQLLLTISLPRRDLSERIPVGRDAVTLAHESPQLLPQFLQFLFALGELTIKRSSSCPETLRVAR
jgi:hypothetical protein